MTYLLIYELDKDRLISAVINDARNTIPATTNQIGTVIYAYIQTQIALVTPDVLFYRITTVDGNLGGYVGIQVQDGVASVKLVQLRPAFIPFSDEILNFISTFIQQRIYVQDQLF